MWHRREIGTIGFQHELAGRRRGEGVAHGLRILKSRDAGETDQRSHGLDALLRGGILAEAMEHAAQFALERLHLRQHIVERVALVNDAIETELGGDFHLLPEKVGLFLFVAFFFGRAEPRFRAWQPMIVQAGFANRHHLGMPRQFAQLGPHIGRRFAGVTGMPAHRREHAGKLFAQLQRSFAARQIGADGDDLRNPRRVCALDNLGQIRSEVWKIQMRVGVVKNRHDGKLRGKLNRQK